MTPNIEDIRRDDQMLDAIGGRRPPRHTDVAGDALQEWVRQIDAPDHPRPVGRYARTRHTRARVGVIAAITVGTLSVSGVAAAVSGVPGLSRVAQQMGFVHRSSDFGAGAAGPVSTRAATSVHRAPAGTRSAVTGDQGVTRMPSTGIGLSPSSQSRSSRPSALPRVLPGAVLRHHGAPPGTTSASPAATSASPRSSAPPSSAPSSTSSSTSSATPTTPTPRSTPSSSSTSPGSPTRRPHPTHPPRPPKPTRSPSPTATSTTGTPIWSPIVTPSSSSSSSSGSSQSSSSGVPTPTSTDDGH